MFTKQNFHIWPARGATNIIRFYSAFLAKFSRVPWAPLESPSLPASRLSFYMSPEYVHNIETPSDTFPLSWELFRISGYFSKSRGLGIASPCLGIISGISPIYLWLIWSFRMHRSKDLTWYECLGTYFCGIDGYFPYTPQIVNWAFWADGNDGICV